MLILCIRKVDVLHPASIQGDVKSHAAKGTRTVFFDLPYIYHAGRCHSRLSWARLLLTILAIFRNPLSRG